MVWLSIALHESLILPVAGILSPIMDRYDIWVSQVIIGQELL